jgi:hypothetical protein
VDDCCVRDAGWRRQAILGLSGVLLGTLRPWNEIDRTIGTATRNELRRQSLSNVMSSYCFIMTHTELNGEINTISYQLNQSVTGTMEGLDFSSMVFVVTLMVWLTILIWVCSEHT